MPDWTTDLRARLAELRLNPAREAEIVEELSQHLDDRYEELRAAGSSDADARRLALEELSEAGGLARRMQALSQAQRPAPVVQGQPGAGLLRGIWQDLRYAVRTVRRQPGFATAADPPQAIQVLARSASGPAAAAGFVGDQVRALDPDLPLLPMSTVDETLALQLWPQRLFGSMFALFASIAMLLATCGLYAVTAYAVSRRTREIGVRVALGADARSVWWAVTGTTLQQLAIGLALGTAGAAAVATLLPAILVGTGGANLLAFAGVAAVLVAAGVVASAVPARRAMRLDPVTALQTE